jgi:hypothetical protein
MVATYFRGERKEEERTTQTGEEKEIEVAG